MVKSDAWRKRPAVLKYWAFKDLAALCGAAKLPASPGIVLMEVTVAMPKSWSKKRKAEMLGKPHQQKPDADNFLKSLDAIWAEDSSIWDARVIKRWGLANQTIVTVTEL